MKLLNIGFGNMVNADRIIGIVSPDSAPIKRLVQDARESAAEEYREAVRGAVDENVRSVLVLPTAGVLARHARAREILESAEGR